MRRALSFLLLAGLFIVMTGADDTRPTRRGVIDTLRREGITGRWVDGETLAVSISNRVYTNAGESIRAFHVRGLQHTLETLITMSCLPNGLRYLIWLPGQTNWVTLSRQDLEDYYASPLYSRSSILNMVVGNVLFPTSRVSNR